MSANSDKKMTFAKCRSAYNRAGMNQILSFGRILKEIQQDSECTNLQALADAAEAVKKALADAKKAGAGSEEIKHLQDCKKAADAKYNEMQQRAANPDVQERLKAFNEMLDTAKFERCDITPAFLKQWLPNAYDSAGRLCDCKQVAVENEMQARADAEAGLYEIREQGAVMYRLDVIQQWTIGRLMQKFAAAAKVRAAYQKAENQLQREQERAAKKAATLAALKAKVARMEQEQEQEQKAAAILSEMKAEAAKEQEQKA